MLEFATLCIWFAIFGTIYFMMAFSNILSTTPVDVAESTQKKVARVKSVTVANLLFLITAVIIVSCSIILS